MLVCDSADGRPIHARSVDETQNRSNSGLGGWILAGLLAASGSSAAPTSSVAATPSAPDLAHYYVEYGIAALLVLQTILIVMLMIQNHRQKRLSFDAQRQQADFTHAARLVLVGEITASIAHEVSQPLSAILSNADAADILLGRQPPPIAEVRQILSDIRRDDLRANDIVRHLRTLLRKRELQKEFVNLNQISQSVVTLIQPDAIRRNIIVRSSFEPALPPISADPVHLQQVLLNLVVNAMDAMTNAPINMRCLDICTRQLDQNSIGVSVTDTGPGIAPEQMARVFDSFFTTKRDGMGLGLSIARTIVQAHGGTIWAENSATGGAVFRFSVPLHAA